MKAIVHFPKATEEQVELRHRIAMMHADGIISYINGLPYTKQQKLDLLNAVISEAKQLALSNRNMS